MMIVIAKTKLFLSMKEFWMMTPKVYYELTDALLRTLNPKKEAAETVVQNKKQGGDIILDELPAGMVML